jgi:endonuclease YncB( thermonuclease family)
MTTLIIILTACSTSSSKPKKYSEFDIIIDRIVDGDTIDVRFPGETQKKRIRILGIQAMEMHSGANTRNDCWADEAKERLKQLTGGEGAIVTLRSQDEKIEIRDRLARHVFVEVNGEEINVSEKLLEEGLVFPFLHYSETTHNKAYMKAAERAKEKHLGLWNKNNHCSTKADSFDVHFDLEVQVDAVGYDKKNLNGEWVKIKNISGRDVDISGWWLRDSALHFFRFPANTNLVNNEDIIVYGGKGEASDNIYYWGNKKPIFDNHAEGVYLHDYLDDSVNLLDEVSPKGNIKASYLYIRK